MKLVNLFGAGALIAATLIAAAPAEAQRYGYRDGHYSGWHHRGPVYRGGYRPRAYGGYRPYRYGYRHRPYGDRFGYRHHDGGYRYR